MKSRFENVTIVVFVILIFFPFMAKLLALDTGIRNNENRRLASEPEITFASFFNFPNRYNEYYNDHFGFRNEMVWVYNVFKTYILKTTPLTSVNRGVILGRDNWFFLNSRYVFADLMNEKFFSKERLRYMSSKFNARVERLESKGIIYQVFVVPNKHTVYPEFLPDYFPDRIGKSNLDYVLSSLKKHSSNVIDARQEFIESKNSSMRYYRTDSHWNRLGAFDGYKMIMKELKSKRSDIKFLRNKDFRKDTTVFDIGELTRMLGVYDFEQENEPVLILKRGASYKKLPKKKTPFYGKNTMITKNKEALNDLKVLLIGDSFIKNIHPYLAESFKEVLSVQSHNFSYEVIKKEKPDIVLHIIPERNIQMLQMGD